MQGKCNRVSGEAVDAFLPLWPFSAGKFDFTHFL